jgi:hypothetical protein
MAFLLITGRIACWVFGHLFSGVEFSKRAFVSKQWLGCCSKTKVISSLLSDARLWRCFLKRHEKDQAVCTFGAIMAIVCWMISG